MADLKKILIVEDDTSQARVLKLKLSKAGFATKIVLTGEEALKVLEKGRFELILLDLILPRMNGFEVLSELKKRENVTPVIVLTNLGQKEDVEKARELGASTYIVKARMPLAEMVSKIKQVLNKK